MATNLGVVQQHWRSEDYAWNPFTLTAAPSAQGLQQTLPLEVDDLDMEDAFLDLPDEPALAERDSAKPTSSGRKLNCQVVGCTADLSGAKGYYQRYRICHHHLQLLQQVVHGRLCRFCQQCGKFHDLAEFDGNRRSCRNQLNKHNARRRKRAALKGTKRRDCGAGDTEDAAEEGDAEGLGDARELEGKSTSDAPKQQAPGSSHSNGLDDSASDFSSLPLLDKGSLGAQQPKWAAPSQAPAGQRQQVLEAPKGSGGSNTASTPLLAREYSGPFQQPLQPSVLPLQAQSQRYLQAGRSLQQQKHQQPYHLRQSQSLELPEHQSSSSSYFGSQSSFISQALGTVARGPAAIAASLRRAAGLAPAEPPRRSSIPQMQSQLSRAASVDQSSAAFGISAADLFALGLSPEDIDVSLLTASEESTAAHHDSKQPKNNSNSEVNCSSSPVQQAFLDFLGSGTEPDAAGLPNSGELMDLPLDAFGNGAGTAGPGAVGMGGLGDLMDTNLSPDDMAMLAAMSAGAGLGPNFDAPGSRMMGGPARQHMDHVARSRMAIDSIYGDPQSSYDVCKAISVGGGAHTQYMMDSALVRLSIKMHDCTPDQLHPQMQARLRMWLAKADVSLIQGHVRPGCTMLVLDTLDSYPLSQRGGLDTGVDSLVACLQPTQLAGLLGHDVVESSAVTVQAPRQLVTMRNMAVLKRAVVGQQQADDGSGLVPEIGIVMPLCVHADRSLQLLLSGRNIADDSVKTFVRSQGRFMETARVPLPMVNAARACSETDSDCGSSEQLPELVQVSVGSGMLQPGLYCVEAEAPGGVMSNWRPLLVLPDAGMVKEVSTLEAHLVLQMGALQSSETSLASSSSSGASSSSVRALQSEVEQLLVDLGLLIQFHEVSSSFREAPDAAISGHSALRPVRDEANITGLFASERAVSLSMDPAAATPLHVITSLSPVRPVSASMSNDLIASVQSMISDDTAYGMTGSNQGMLPERPSLSQDLLASQPDVPTGSGSSSSAMRAGTAGDIVHPYLTPAFKRHIARVGTRLLVYAADRGWPETFAHVLSLLVDEGLELTHVISAASLQGGLPLLHRAVRSGNPAIVHVLLNWGRMYSLAWNWAQPGPAGVTPLHIAATLPDGGVMAAFLTRAVPGIAHLWFSAKADDGAEPAALAAREGRHLLNSIMERLRSAGEAPPLPPPGPARTHALFCVAPDVARRASAGAAALAAAAAAAALRVPQAALAAATAARNKAAMAAAVVAKRAAVEAASGGCSGSTDEYESDEAPPQRLLSAHPSPVQSGSGDGQARLLTPQAAPAALAGAAPQDAPQDAPAQPHRLVMATSPSAHNQHHQPQRSTVSSSVATQFPGRVLSHLLMAAALLIFAREGLEPLQHGDGKERSWRSRAASSVVAGLLTLWLWPLISDIAGGAHRRHRAAAASGRLAAINGSYALARSAWDALTLQFSSASVEAQYCLYRSASLAAVDAALGGAAALAAGVLMWSTGGGGLVRQLALGAALVLMALGFARPWLLRHRDSAVLCVCALMAYSAAAAGASISAIPVYASSGAGVAAAACGALAGHALLVVSQVLLHSVNARWLLCVVAVRVVCALLHLQMRPGPQQLAQLCWVVALSGAGLVVSYRFQKASRIAFLRGRVAYMQRQQDERLSATAAAPAPAVAAPAVPVA